MSERVLASRYIFAYMNCFESNNIVDALEALKAAANAFYSNGKIWSLLNHPNN